MGTAEPQGAERPIQAPHKPPGQMPPSFLSVQLRVMLLTVSQEPQGQEIGCCSSHQGWRECVCVYRGVQDDSVVIHWDRCWLLREKSGPSEALLAEGQSPSCPFSSHSARAVCTPTQCPPEPAMPSLTLGPSHVAFFLWEPPFPPLGLINTHSSFRAQLRFCFPRGASPDSGALLHSTLHALYTLSQS